MAHKKINKFIILGVIVAVGLMVLVTCSDKKPGYTSIDKVPDYEQQAKADGDTTTDTIKALQAYAKAAVDKADDLNQTTQSRLQKILENENDLHRLGSDHQKASDELEKTQAEVKTLESKLLSLTRTLQTLEDERVREQKAYDNYDLPVGFGFDDNGQIQQKGHWYEPADIVSLEGGQKNEGFSRLLKAPSRAPTKQTTTTKAKDMSPVIPVYTIPKDTLLFNAVAFNALVGRIPVGGETPDPYPVRIFIGEDNLAANGHDIPEIEGMIFSGYGIGDWNLSCVRARLFSATYIFKDGAIVNHTSDQPLATISDPQGIPCVAGRFITNAPAFLSQRIGLAGIGAAGSAYAQSQIQTDTSSLTGSTSQTVIGDLDKLAIGNAVQSATDEVQQWLLERQQQSFDAVVVNPGASVAVHIETSLPIDYDPNARKIRYAKNDTRTITALD